MNTLLNKTQSHRSQPAANEDLQKRNRGESAMQIVDNRPQAAAQRKLQEMADNSPRATQLKALQNIADSQAQSPLTQLKKDNNFSGGAVIQMVNRLTMHTPPRDPRLSGGGIGSNIDTGQEVQDVIDSGVLQDMIDSRNALRRSIQVRQAALHLDPGHAGRIVLEQGWLAQLNEAIEPLEKAKQKAWQDSLRGPKPPPSSGSGWTPPPGPVWGKA